jgi:hypothetical protein
MGILSSFALYAQDSASKAFTITGSADLYYRKDFAKSDANNFTSFTSAQKSLELGMASVKLEYKPGKLDLVADLGFGPKAREFAYNDKGVFSSVKQLYASYSVTDWFKLTAGTWATHVGYELLDPQLNRNYSMAYMFTNGPFSHTGVKAEATKGKSGFMIGLSNATDYRKMPSGLINKKFLIAQYSIAFNDNIKLFLNYVGGKNPDTSKVSQFDAVLTAKLSDKFSVGYNGTINTTKAWNGAKNVDGKTWSGNAFYLNYDPVSFVGITVRQEFFNDKNQLKVFAASAAGSSVSASTFSANFKVGSFIFIPELRYESAGQAIYKDVNNRAVKSATNFIFAAIYSF